MAKAAFGIELDTRGFPVAAGRSLYLAPKERAVLALLVEHAGHVVDKIEFADRAWCGAEMSDESLARCVSRLRRVLLSFGTTIESVYGTGYRLGRVATLARHARLLAAAQAPPAQAEAYLHAHRLALQRTPSALARAARLLRGLVEADPGYASARVALAETLAASVAWGIAESGPAIDEGLAQLDALAGGTSATPGLASARACLLDLAWRFDEAAVWHRQAAEGSPDDPETSLMHGRHLLVTGATDAAVECLRGAVQRHPHSALLRISHARALAHAGRLAEALAEARETRDDHPDSALASIYRIGLLAFVRPEPALLDGAWRAAEAADAPPIALSVVAYATARLGRRAEALAITDAALACSAAAPGVPVLHVAALLECGTVARAVDTLLQAETARSGLLPMVLRDPANTAAWREPRVRQLVQRVFGRAAAQAGAGRRP